MNPDRVRFVLVRPEEAGNVGAAARVLKNFGFGRLVLVSPHLARPQEAARWAHGAEDVLESAEWVDRLEEAIAPCARAWATSRRPGKLRGRVLTVREAAAELRPLAGAGEDTAWVFGPESRGLGTRELAVCSGRVVIPTSPRQPSLNLAQAVAICCYETFVADAPARAGRRECTIEERDALSRHLEEALLAIGYMNPATTPVRMGRIRGILDRARLAPAEVRLLRGVARQILWAARKPGKPS